MGEEKTVEAEDVRLVLLLGDPWTSSSTSTGSGSTTASIRVLSVVVARGALSEVTCVSLSKNASTELPFCRCSFKVHLAVSRGANLWKHDFEKMF